jgi:hypothetical protein
VNDAPRPSRRQVVRTAAHAAWAAPVIVAASAAPAAANGSVLPAPAVTTSEVAGTRPNAFVVDATMTFTNSGAAASSLSVPVKIRILDGSFTNAISQVADGWTVSPGTPDGNGGWDYTFTRAAGIGAGQANAQTLTFRFPASGNGTIIVSSPTTTPAGTNLGAVGLYPAV